MKVPEIDMHVRYNRVGTSALLVMGNKGYELNGLGREIWSLIDNTRTVEEIVRIIASRYSKSESDISEEIDEYICQLEEYGLIHILDK